MTAHGQSHAEKSARMCTVVNEPRVILTRRVTLPRRRSLSWASDLRAELIVVSTHGKRGKLGYDQWNTVTLAPCPVLIVREKCPLTRSAARRTAPAEKKCSGVPWLLFVAGVSIG